jgi:hypothetical protein
MYPYPEIPEICWDSKGYVMAVIAWHGKIVVTKRTLESADALKLAKWLSKTTRK